MFKVFNESVTIQFDGLTVVWSVDRTCIVEEVIIGLQEAIEFCGNQAIQAREDGAVSEANEYDATSDRMKLRLDSFTKGGIYVWSDKAKKNLIRQRLAIANAILDGYIEDAKMMCVVYISSIEGFRVRGFITEEEAPHLGAEINRYLEKLQFSV